MKKSEEILTEVKNILSTAWQTRDGRKVPEPSDIKLGNDAVKLDGTVLYADITDSTGLVKGHKDWFAAEVYKSYLSAACYVIRNRSGVITAFDGDRVMAVFIGSTKNSDAAKASLQIKFITDKINEEIKKAYPTTSYRLQQAIGIHSSALFVARTGIRDNNDLVWVGQAANYGAKLCSLATETHPIHITKTVFDSLNETSKYSGAPRKSMWEKRTWTGMGLTVYRTSWHWKF